MQNGNLVITGGNFNTAGTTLCVYGSSRDYASLTVTDGSFRTTSTEEPCLDMTGIGDLLITGGYFEAQGAKNHAVELYDTQYDWDIDYLIDGGTFACNYDELPEGYKWSGVIKLYPTEIVTDFVTRFFETRSRQIESTISFTIIMLSSNS